MSADDIIKAWKDEEFRLKMGGASEAFPQNPAGLIELTDEALDQLIAGNMAEDSCCWDSCIKIKAPTKLQ